ncbi:hypothetical protein [Vibrio sp. B1FLJ16]|uniref:hypothetical protein n=1 Tax=Vibrio sp. B1FLJ16 TaxID=2751178 RepID=UPI0015F72B99|nr:hypothetical protein [Vibrio sp. B1FLJ16]CAD7807481.1 hypothetical protein ACOMICROBIO_EPCKBFOG_01677 [Vibrio sp. B1FLJ16]CAE6905727.1 hypothetical protein ACOMICROBIO_EPCKBFOG_01677 [Vibrio sp. B1FLJ16]
MTDADIELQHIWLEVQAERWHNISRFLFSYYCYKHNHVSKTNKPCWETARNTLPASSAVQTCKNCVIEPLVPEDTVVGLLKALSKDGEMSFDAMAQTVQDFLYYVVITKQEQTKLKPHMPASWYQEGAKPLMSRFELAGISVR